jgi:hypothetical protein
MNQPNANIVKSFKAKWIIVILILFILPLLLPIFHQGMMVTDDGNWNIIRLSDFHQSLRDGQFPVRWGMRLNHEFGYPVFDFLYPGVYYLGEIFHVIKINTVNSTKILFGLSFLFSGISTFLWLKNKFSKMAAVAGALLYCYFPYHLYDVYSRGSLGEALALMFVPLILYALDRKKIILGSIGYAFLILTHNTLALLFTPLLLLYTFLLTGAAEISSHCEEPRGGATKQSTHVYPLHKLLVFLLGLGLSAFFWNLLFHLILRPFSDLICKILGSRG